VLYFLLAATGALAQTPGAGIVGTAHDPAIWSFGFEQQVCIMCHTPHNAKSQGPLWNHAMSTATYTLYGSSTMKAASAQPGSVSKLCLSCHDGTIGVLDYGAATGGMTLAQAYAPGTGASVLGVNLSNDHPVGITYDAALVARNPGLLDPATTTVTVGSTISKKGTVNAQLLVEGKVECSTCHDVHNIYTVATGAGSSRGLVKVDLTGSKLCLQCHAK
jgi:hypothetical protein